MFALGNPEGPLYIPGSSIVINDMNPELVVTYEVIRDDVSSLIQELKILGRKITEKQYYEIRESSPKTKVKRAARFIYLNKTCYNGLWRVNSKGEFNVPFGKSVSPSLFSEENLRACSQRLKGAKITLQSFHEAVDEAKKGDLVYFDPPYIPLTTSASFAQYAKAGFGQADHELLAATIESLTKRGVYVLLSNSDTPLTRKIFRKQLTLRKLLMSRTISSSGNTRNPVFELLGMNYAHLRGSLVGKLEVVSRPK